MLSTSFFRDQRAFPPSLLAEASSCVVSDHREHHAGREPRLVSEREGVSGQPPKSSHPLRPRHVSGRVSVPWLLVKWPQTSSRVKVSRLRGPPCPAPQLANPPGRTPPSGVVSTDQAQTL